MNTHSFTHSAALALAVVALAAPAARADVVVPDQDLRTPPAQNLRGADAQGAPNDSPPVVVVPVVRTAPAPATPDNGLDWAAAAAGAGGLLGLSLIGLGGTLLVTHRRRPGVHA